jgi:hypothetical protein
MLLRRGLSLLALPLLLVGCPTPPTPAERASDAARELNMAARWGNVQVAAGLTVDDLRSEFLKKRASWGGPVRIIDTELAGIELQDSSNATIYVDVSWVRIDETTLRVTRLEQKWSDKGGAWRMKAERRQGGDLGLLGEPVERDSDPRPAAQFPTRVIR